MGDSIFQVSGSPVELYLDNRDSSVQTIRIESSEDLMTWSTLEEVRGKGHNTDNQDGYRNKVYFAFDPDDYGLSYPFFLRFVDVAGGSDVSTSDIHIIIDISGGSSSGVGDASGLLEFSGTAPEGTVIGDSIELSLSNVTRIRIDNTDDNVVALYVAFNSSGPEREIGAHSFLEWEGPVSTLFLRGEGADCDFSVLATTG